jgi:hydrogenase nickel incorporation protein HypB
MCDTCGCGNSAQPITFSKPGEQGHSHLHSHTHDHDHEHDHHHHHHDPNPSGRSISVEQDVLSKNNLLAERNRGFFEARNIFAINLLSSPGSGKTTLLEQTITNLKDEMVFSCYRG